MELEEFCGGGYDASIPGPVLDDPALRWPAMILYANIKRYAKRSGYCYATNETLIRAMTRMDPKTGAVNAPTERSLQSWLSELKDHGHIRVDIGPIPPGKNGKPRSGRRIFVGMKLADPPENMGEENFTPENNFAEGVKKISPHTSYPNNKKKERVYSPPSDLWERCTDFCDGDKELEAALLGFLESRCIRKNPLSTGRALSILLNKLKKLSDGDHAVMTAMLDKAVLKNWDSVFPLKSDEMPQQEQDSQKEAFGWE